VDLSRVRGSGPGGRIVEKDVEEAAALTAATPAAPSPAGPPTAPGAPARTAAASPAGPGGPDATDVELTRMRRAIARSVTQSKQEQPHFYVTSEADMSRALQFRDDLRAAYGESDGKVSVNDLIVKAAAVALRKHPALNAQIVDDKTLRRFNRVHIGVMVAIPDGLIVPVLRDADTLPLLQLAREARRLIEGARKGHLRQDEFTGATFSISNLGLYDVTNFVAILSHPQAGILAVGRAQERAVVRDGHIVARPILEMTISADHRVTDGVGAAEFLVEVKRLLENPLLLLN
jgi:pyruvate dehydrogenase E2 component (dihydrolipoamide acetyltransferase)